MKLQLALDIITLPDALRLLETVQDSIDIVEVGTPFVLQDGVRAVREIKKSFPRLEVLADLKIMDAGEYESMLGFEAGADIVTVLGAADDATILGAVHSARRREGQVMVDMIGVSQLEHRVREIDALGVDYICVHTAFDLQHTGRDPLSDLQRLTKTVKSAKTAVAGGIKLATLDPILQLSPSIVIVGGGIMGQPDCKATAAAIKQRMLKAEGKS